MDEFFNGLNPDRFTSTTSEPASSTLNPDAFRVTELFLAPTEVELLQEATNNQFYDILNSELNLGGDDSNNDALDEDETGDGFFALATPTPVQAMQVAAYSTDEHGHSQVAAPVHDDSNFANDSWIDRAPVAMAIASPVVLALKPKSWLGKLVDGFSRRKN